MSRMLGFLHDRVQQDGHTVDYFASENVDARYQGRWSRFAFPWFLYKFALQQAKVGKPYDVINVHEPMGAWLNLRRSRLGNPFIVATSHGVESRVVGCRIRGGSSRTTENVTAHTAVVSAD